MGCKTSGDLCEGFGGVSSDHCFRYRPPNDGVTFEFTEYPPYQIRGSSYNIPDREANAVMYPSIQVCTDEVGGTTEPEGANCGKVSVASPCTSFGADNCTLHYDYYPTELSFDHMLSDTWISFLYDTSSDAGVAGTPCYYLEEETRASTTTGTDPVTGDPTETSSTERSVTCVPCTAFYCTPAETTLRYTADEDLTGDPDCPHPTLFAIGTSSNKIAFRYDALSTTAPDGVLDFSFSYDGSTYVDVWDEGLLEGVAYDSSQNTWQQGDEAFRDFEIFEIESGATKTGFSIKVYIEPIFDDTVTPTVFTGTRWTVSEFISPGTGYDIDDVFQLSYLHTHPDNSQSTLTLNIKITDVGPIPIVEGQEGFDVLRVGDTINGHVITRTFHTDIDNFPYQVAYLDGDGSDFVKDTQYTSDRAHVITVKAGYGIPDRAMLVGLYEFLDKSVQYVTADLSKNAPDTFETLVQPETTITVTNGQVISVQIDDGGSGWNQLGQEPVLEITSPQISSGKSAVVKGTFSNGQLTSVTIVDRGSGYRDDYPPKVFVRNVYARKTQKFVNEGYNAATPGEFKGILSSFPDGDLKVSNSELNAIDTSYSAIPKEQVLTENVSSIELKKDPERNRIHVQPQRLFSKNATKDLKEITSVKYNLDHFEETPLDRQTLRVFEEERENDIQRREKTINDITQEQIPEVSIFRENLINTVQGSLSQLPHASRYTKYIIRQYRADTRVSTNINISLSCSPVDTGCAHFTCSPPTASIGGTTSTTDPISGDTTDTTTSYTVSSLLGSGCQEWTATGSMKIFHDLTRAAQNVARAAEMYGNPYDE